MIFPFKTRWAGCLEGINPNLLMVGSDIACKILGFFWTTLLIFFVRNVWNLAWRLYVSLNKYYHVLENCNCSMIVHHIYLKPVCNSISSVALESKKASISPHGGPIKFKNNFFSNKKIVIIASFCQNWLYIQKLI